MLQVPSEFQCQAIDVLSRVLLTRGFQKAASCAQEFPHTQEEGIEID